MIALALFVAAAAAPATLCELPPGWAAVAARQARYIVLGETHGTEQAPAFTGQLACALSSHGRPLLVAIEQSATDNVAFQRIWAGPDHGFADRLRAAPGWKGRSDGVASEAMLAMLLRLHRLRGTGRQIDVVLFNGARDEAQRPVSQTSRGRADTKRRRPKTSARPPRRGLTITSSFCRAACMPERCRSRVAARHFGRWPCSLRRPPRSPHFGCFPGPVRCGTVCLSRVALNPGAPVPSEAIDCGLHPTHAMTSLSGPPFAALGMPAAWIETGYDGHVWLGPSTGSAPAVP